MRVRVERTIEVKPENFRELLQLSLEGAEYVEAQTNIRPDIFWVRHGEDRPTVVKAFMDFDSLAQYEEQFLETLLQDAAALTLAERGMDMVVHEPIDELLVLMDKDDFFMNLRDDTKLTPSNVARGATQPQRYRLCRHMYVRTGRLRDSMKAAFDFMDRFERVAGFRPELYCTRFTRDSIGGLRQFFDYDNCPMCDTALMDWTGRLGREASDLLVAPTIDKLYVRATAEDLAFDLHSA